MDKISLKKGIQIEVNDKGDTITVNIDDQTLIDRFYSLLDKLQAVKEEVKTEAKGKTEREALQFYIGKIKSIMEEIDNVFGEGCCRKVFGDIVPSPFLIAEFFEQMTPVLEKYAKERRQRIAAKYSSARKGGRRR